MLLKWKEVESSDCCSSNDLSQESWQLNLEQLSVVAIRHYTSGSLFLSTAQTGKCNDIFGFQNSPQLVLPSMDANDDAEMTEMTTTAGSNGGFSMAADDDAKMTVTAGSNGGDTSGLASTDKWCIGKYSDVDVTIWREFYDFEHELLEAEYDTDDTTDDIQHTQDSTEKAQNKTNKEVIAKKTLLIIKLTDFLLRTLLERMIDVFEVAVPVAPVEEIFSAADNIPFEYDRSYKMDVTSEISVLVATAQRSVFAPFNCHCEDNSCACCNSLAAKYWKRRSGAVNCCASAKNTIETYFLISAVDKADVLAKLEACSTTTSVAEGQIWKKHLLCLNSNAHQWLNDTVSL